LALRTLLPKKDLLPFLKLALVVLAVFLLMQSEISVGVVLITPLLALALLE
jgi:hypothetical protein